MPALRLVNSGTIPQGAPLPERHGAPRLGIARENRAAAEAVAVGASIGAGAGVGEVAGVSATDARWVFAVQVAKGLEGGRGAVLPPERRQSLVTVARAMGLRPFDANLIIAVVQDGVRHGQGGLSREVEERLAFIRGVEQSSDGWWTVAMVLLTAAIGLGVFCVLARWVGF